MTWSEKATVAAVIGLLALPTPMLADKFDSSAGNFVPRCRAVVTHERDKAFDLGLCAGAMIALHDDMILLQLPSDHPLRSCLPDNVTVEQSIAVVVRWFDRHPQSRQENFMWVAMSAMHEAWPCDD
jgi:hypothetical protein